MIHENGIWKHTFRNAIGRWSGVGPYYAMFPNKFAFEVISRFTQPDDWVLDPFAGRFSSIYAATSQGRNGMGIEINPVGWVYGQAKLHPAPRKRVEARLIEIGGRAKLLGNQPQQDLPDFFQHCYSPAVLSFLLTARRDLDWANDAVDITLMALILVFLHAKSGSGLSNQMRQSKAMAPDYSVRWWTENGMVPPDLDPVDFLLHKIEWRYKHGIPEEVGEGIAVLADCTVELQHIAQQVECGLRPRFQLVLTSPPYFDITHYHYDQWLRYWMLGGPSWPSKAENKHRGRFSSKKDYEELLDRTFERVARIVSDDAVIFVRTDKRAFTLNTTRNSLKRFFPNWEMEESDQPAKPKSQTALFGDFSTKPGEVDIVVRNNRSASRIV